MSSAVAATASGGTNSPSVASRAGAPAGSDPGSQCTTPAACRKRHDAPDDGSRTEPSASSSPAGSTPSRTEAPARTVSASRSTAATTALVTSGANREE